jgi:hypothetical protein
MKLYTGRMDIVLGAESEDPAGMWFIYKHQCDSVNYYQIQSRTLEVKEK